MAFASEQRSRSLITSFAVGVILLTSVLTKAEDGYRLWLRYDPVPAPMTDQIRSYITSIVVEGKSAIADAIRSELTVALTGVLGKTPASGISINGDGALLVGTPSSSPLIASLRWDKQLSVLGAEGYVIRSTRLGSHSTIVIASQSDAGALYGTFHFLRLMQTLQSIANLNVSEKPHLRLRVLDHWDNLDGSIERGYAGRSLWDWNA